MFHKLSRDFYRQDALQLSKALIGKYLICKGEGGFIAGRINETECYRGDIDKACHAYPMKRTKRTEVLFGDGGHAYVYLIYGMYYCMNIVAEEIHKPCAILIRGADIVMGKEQAAMLRFGKGLAELDKNKLKNFSNGPGKLCKAMGIDKNLNGLDLCGDIIFGADEIDGIENVQLQIKTSKRIGIDYAEEAKDFLWRFYV